MIAVALGAFALLGHCSCEQAATCDSTGDCGESQLCHQGVCRDACNSSYECRGYEACINGICLHSSQQVQDAAEGDRSVPESGPMDASLPDLALPDSSLSDAAAPDSQLPDAARSDSLLPDSAAPDALLPDSATPDALRPDNAAPDTLVPDSAAPDTSRPDSASVCVVSCPGCCDGEICQANSYPNCGLGGAMCSDCVGQYGARADSCSGQGDCVCAASGGVCLTGLDCGTVACCEVNAITAGDSKQFEDTFATHNRLVSLDGTHFITAYRGPGNNPHAVLLTVDLAAESIGVGTPVQVDTTGLNNMSGGMVALDETRALLTYPGPGSDGFAVVLVANVANGTISVSDAHEFDTGHAVYQSLSRIDGSHFLNAYQSAGSVGKATILAVDLNDNTVSSTTPTQFDTLGQSVSAAAIDPLHHLVTYRGPANVGRAVILSFEASFDSINVGSSIDFDPGFNRSNELVQVDETRFLNAYASNEVGNLVLLEVDVNGDQITELATEVFDPVHGRRNRIFQIDGGHFIGTYRAAGEIGAAYIATVELAPPSIAVSHSMTFATSLSEGNGLAGLNEGYFLSSYADASEHGQAALLRMPCNLP